jgi:hypothetical protein
MQLLYYLLIKSSVYIYKACLSNSDRFAADFLQLFEYVVFYDPFKNTSLFSSSYSSYDCDGLPVMRCEHWMNSGLSSFSFHQARS